MVFGTSARSEYRHGKTALGLLGVYTSARDAFLLTERGETRGEPESSRRTVPPELSRPEKREVRNNALVHIYYKTHSPPARC